MSRRTVVGDTQKLILQLIRMRDLRLNIKGNRGRFICDAMATSGAPRTAALTRPLLPSTITSMLPPSKACTLVPLDGM